MELGWIDFSKSDREKAMAVLQLLSEKQSIDELGVGVIRDGFSNFFFPGTSTVQTRAKYFLISSYILKEIQNMDYKDTYGPILKWIKEQEMECCRVMNISGETGIIGSDIIIQNKWVQRAPYQIYLNGIKRYGIVNDPDFNVYRYSKMIMENKKRNSSKALRYRKADLDESEMDDSDAGDYRTFSVWNGELPYQKHWRDNLDISLTKEEAKYLKKMIVKNCSGTLLSYILKNNIEVNEFDDFRSFSNYVYNGVNDELKEMINLANDFNAFYEMLMIRYNCLVYNHTVKQYEDCWNDYLQHKEERLHIDIDVIGSKFDNVKTSTLLFLKKAKDYISNNEIAKLDLLIKQREISLKSVQRAKIGKEFIDGNFIGVYSFDYRFGPAKRIINDIYNGGR